MAEHHIPGDSSDSGAAGAAFVQCGGPGLYRPSAGGGQHGADGHRAGLSADHADCGILFPVRLRRDAAVFHSQGSRRGGAGGEDTGEHLLAAAGLFPDDVPVLLPVPQAGAVSVRGQRRVLCVRGRLSEDLSAGHALCHACHRAEWLHQCPGLPEDGNADHADWRSPESDSGSGLYLRHGNGSGRGGPGHNPEPDGVLCLGAAVPHR